MLNTSAILYLGSRATAAAGNLMAVAIFTRIAGPAEYGHYVLIFAWSMIVYGFGTQWMRFAYFGVYQSLSVNEYVASLAQLLGITMAALAVVFTVLALTQLFDPLPLLAVFTLVCAMTVYEAAFEVTRTRLNARVGAISMILRTCLTIVLGSLTLWLGGGAEGLAFAIALVHFIAAIPCFTTFGGISLSQGSRTASLRILTYGWPLLLSFGVTAVGGSVDRLLLAHFDGAAAVGPYGVVADILRQSFSVFGEAIVLSLVTVAKQHANEGNVEASNRTMRKAFNSCLAAAAFGAAFFLVFGDMLLRLLLRPDFVGPSRDLIPFFTIAFAFMTMRNFYFAQVIYFIHASYLELIVSSLFLVVSIVLSLILIPIYGAHGAAVGLMMSSIVSCVAFMVIGRRWYSLPIDLTGLGSMASLAVIFVLGARWIASLVPSANLMLVIDIVVFVAFSAFAVLRFGLLSSASEIPEPVAVERRVTPTPVAERGS